MQHEEVGLLIPFGNGSKYLRTIRLFRRCSPLVLGRNETTGLQGDRPNAAYVSRQHIMVRVDEASGRVFVSAIGRLQSMAGINGGVLRAREETELTIGGCISFLGASQWYNYRLAHNVPIFEPTEEKAEQESAPAGAKLPSSFADLPNLRMTRTDLQHQVLSQFDCPICQETMAYSCILTPCGCNFCYCCIERWYCYQRKSECPCCKQTFDLTRSLTNYTFDTLMASCVKSVLSKQEVDEWEDRVLVGYQRRQEFYKLHPEYLPKSHTSASLAESLPPEALMELIRARAIQVMDAAALPQNADNAELQERARRAQSVLDRIG